MSKHSSPLLAAADRERVGASQQNMLWKGTTSAVPLETGREAPHRTAIGLGPPRDRSLSVGRRSERRRSRSDDAHWMRFPAPCQSVGRKFPSNRYSEIGEQRRPGRKGLGLSISGQQQIPRARIAVL